MRASSGCLDCCHSPKPLLRNSFAPLTQAGSKAPDDIERLIQRFLGWRERGFAQFRWRIERQPAVWRSDSARSRRVLNRQIVELRDVIDPQRQGFGFHRGRGKPHPQRAALSWVKSIFPL
jgi:hypothetical protein